MAIVMPRSFSSGALSMSSTDRFWMLAFSVERQLMIAAVSVLLLLQCANVFEMVVAAPCCKPGYQLFADPTARQPTCYKAVNDWSANFETGMNGCEAMGAQLATIHSAAENQFILNLSSTVDSPNYMWIGLIKDRVAPDSIDPTANWFWLDKTPPERDYTNWLKGFPGDWNDQTCAIMYTVAGIFNSTGGEWRDANCETLLAPYVCEQQACVCGRTC